MVKLLLLLLLDGHSIELHYLVFLSRSEVMTMCFIYPFERLLVKLLFNDNIVLLILLQSILLVNIPRISLKDTIQWLWVFMSVEAPLDACLSS